jgi:hypothetical protein
MKRNNRWTAAESFERPIRKKNLDGRARHGMDIEDRTCADADDLGSRCNLRLLSQSQSAQLVRRLGCLAASCKKRLLVSLQKLNP